ncbi:MAG: ATP synthase subunit I [Clostridia bacterium]|nr:ATP synthase subunit I [Clostridia bacterium]
MKKIDETVRKETQYVSLWVLILSVLMQAVFLLIGRWDYRVLLGNLLGGGAVILNFFLMGYTIQKALEKEPKEAKAAMQLSHTYRLLFLAVVLIIGATVPVFQLWAVAIPMLFPRIAIAFRSFFGKQ